MYKPGAIWELSIIVYYRRGLLKKAESCFKQALLLRPGFTWAHFNLAATLYDRKMFREAISEYERVLSLDPGFVLSYFKLGEVYRALGDRTRAVE